MATQSYEQLISGANKIRQNELPESNTAALVGEQLLQMVNKQQEESRERVTLNPQLHSRSATYIKRNGLLIRKITIKSSRPFQCAYHPLTP